MTGVDLVKVTESFFSFFRSKRSKKTILFSRCWKDLWGLKGKGNGIITARAIFTEYT